MEQKEKNITPKTNMVFIYSSLLMGLVTLNILFLIFNQSEVKTIQLLKNELIVLEQNKKTIDSSQEVANTYADEIDMINQVFPSEENISQFVQLLEGLVKSYAEVYSLKFNAVAPIKEQDRQFLPLSITLVIDYDKFIQLLEKIELLPYMTHITAVISKNPEGFTGKSEVIIGLKLYVQNPFSSK